MAKSPQRCHCLSGRRLPKILKKTRKIHRLNVRRVRQRSSVPICMGLFFQTTIFLLKWAEEKFVWVVVASSSTALNGFVAPVTPTTCS